MLTIYISWKFIANVFKCFPCYPSYSSSTSIWGTLDKSYRNHKKSVIKISQVHVLEIIRSGQKITMSRACHRTVMGLHERWGDVKTNNKVDSHQQPPHGKLCPLHTSARIYTEESGHGGDITVTLLWSFWGPHEPCIIGGTNYYVKTRSVYVNSMSRVS